MLAVLLYTVFGVFDPEANVESVKGSPSAVATKEACGQLKGWRSSARPTEDVTLCASRSLRSWRVELLDDGVPIAVPNAELEKRRDALPFEFSLEMETKDRLARRTAARLGNLWVVGIDLGSYGGGLWVAKPDGTGQRRLWDQRVRDIREVEGEVYVLARGSAKDSGVLLQMVQHQDQPEVRRIAEFEGYPVGAVPLGDGLVLVSRRGLYTLGPNGQLTRSARFSLESLYPTSVVAACDGSLYVGMRHFILRLRMAAGEWGAEWLEPDNCRGYILPPPDNEPCRCAPW